MSNERDPVLETLFAEAKLEINELEISELEINENLFSDQVMDCVEKRRRNVFLGRIALLALLVAFELILSQPVTHSVGAITEMLGTSLFDIETDWLANVVSPLNSVAGLIGVLLVGSHSLYRRFVR